MSSPTTGGLSTPLRSVDGAARQRSSKSHPPRECFPHSHAPAIVCAAQRREREVLVQSDQCPAKRGGGLALPDHLELQPLCYEERKSRLLGCSPRCMSSRVGSARTLGAMEVSGRLRQPDGVFYDGEGSASIVRLPYRQIASLDTCKTQINEL